MTLADEYHRYQQRTFRARGQAYPVVTKPGIFSWPRLDYGTELLIERMEITPTDTVLDLGCGYGIAGLAAARLAPEGQIYLVDSNVVAVEASRRTLALNEVSNARVRLSDVASAVQDIPFDVVLSHLPRGKVLAHQFIADAATVLKPGGQFFLAGHKRAGIKPFVDFAEEVFGNAEVLGYKKGHRVALCVKREQTTVPQTDYHQWREFSAEVREQTVSFVSKPGVFSWNELDPGTKILVETMTVRPDDVVLDLGCGSGIVGLTAAKQAIQGQVYLADSSAIAVEAARRTLTLNRVSNAEVHLSDGAAALRDVRFDLVATNPPFHQGCSTDYNVAHQFIRDAASVLEHRGRLYVVTNRFIRYERQMKEHFYEVDVAYEDNLYRVLLGTGRKQAGETQT